MLYEKGPLLLACNHPNSFLDALILGTYFKHPVHFLARGDAFKNTLVKKIFTALKMIPIYRLSEGKEYLALNDTTFERCAEILVNGGIVLIFSEGLCINQWKLRQLKKGSARIALNAWKQPGILNSFRILPVSLNYSSFSRFRKNIIIDFGIPIKKNDLPAQKSEGEQITDLNKLIYQRLEDGLITEENNKSTIGFLLSNFSFLKVSNKGLIKNIRSKQSFLRNIFEEYFNRLKGTKRVALKREHQIICLLSIPIFFIPALVALAIHLPLYLPLKDFIKKKTKGTVFYHSALFGALIVFYPLYVLIITAILVTACGSFAFLLCVLFMPLLAFVFLFWKDCAEALANWYRLSKNVREKIKSIVRDH